MNFLCSSFAVLMVFAHTAEAIKWGKAVLKKDTPYRPLALTRKHGSTSLELAIPRRFEKSTTLAEYHYISENENGPTEEFLTACPASGKKQRQIEDQWKAGGKFDRNSLFFMQENIGEDTECMLSAIPSVQKVPRKTENDDVEYCGPSKAEIYEIGFAVSADDEGEDIQFLKVYEVCFSYILTNQRPYQGTIFTVHRILSPSLMLLKLIEDYLVIPLNSYESNLGECNPPDVQSFYENYYAFKFVGKYDMPTRSLMYTTKFPFNYTPIPRQRDLYEGMVSIDNYLRLFSLMNNKKLTFHSGIYEKPSDLDAVPSELMEPTQNPLVKSFWRIVIDEEFKAILVVTQWREDELKNCGDTFICSEGRTMLKVYKNGGCSYTCPVSDEIIQKLGSPRFKIGGNLPSTIKFPQQKESLKPSQTIESREEIQEGYSNAESETVIADISDFLGEDTFSVVLMKFDPQTAKMITETTEIKGYDTEG